MLISLQPTKTMPASLAFVSLTLLAAMTPVQVQAVAFCALRDPVNTIYELYPKADSYRSDVRTVGRKARNQVHAVLPFSMHFNELGRHTLYVAQQGNDPVGFVHARSEQGDWGLTEIAWAITPKLTINGLKIQRSRDPKLRRQLTQELKDSLSGQSLGALVARFNSMNSRTSALEKTLVMSAIKTLVITDSVWRDLLEPSRVFELSHQWFPTLDNGQLLTGIYDATLSTALEALDLWKTPVFERDAMTGYRLLDNEGATLGFLFNTLLDDSDAEKSQWWITSLDGEIKQVIDNRAGTPDPDFSGVTGYAPQHARNCSNLTELAALEIATIARRYAQ